MGAVMRYWNRRCNRSTVSSCSGIGRPQPIVIDPALDRVQPLHALLACDARAVRRRDLLGKGTSNDNLVQGVVVESCEPLLGLVEHCALVVAERVVVTDVLTRHLLDRARFAVVRDGKTQDR